MSTLPEIQYPRSDRWSYLWLAIGVVLLILSTGEFRLALAAWVAPAFLIRFFRSQRTGWGYWILLLALYAAYAISWHRILNFVGPLWVFLIFNIMITLQNSLPFLADRMLAPRIKGFATTAIYPLAVTSLFLLYNLASPIGSFGTPGYEQYHNLALIQLVSVTGLWGLTLLVSWFGPVVNWAWERSFHWPNIRVGLAVWAGVVGTVLIFGGLRLALAPSPASTVRIHSFSPEAVEPPANLDKNTDLEGIYRFIQARNELLITDTIREARRGAQIVLWPERIGGGLVDDANALVAQAQAVARQEGIYLAMGLQINYPNQERPWENKLVVIAPSGEIIINHDKYGATFLYSMMDFGEAFQGKYALQSAQTPYGTLTGGVCWDADFPMTMKQAGQQKADIILMPFGDFPGPVAALHAQQSIFRAIENGASLVRHTYDAGLSVAVDPYGRILAALDVGTASEPVMVAQVPTRRVFALYPIIGDVFAWLSLAGFVALVFLASVRPQSREEKAAYAAH